MLPDNFHTMTGDEKRDVLLNLWVSPEGKPFPSPEAAEKYRSSAQRFRDVIKLKKPDRVPAFMYVGGMIADYAGITHADMLYEYKKAADACVKFHKDFDLEYQTTFNFMPGPVYDLLDYKLYRWSGNQLPDNIAFQALEDEFMKVEDYDALIADPESFYTRIYMPRAFGALAGFQYLPSFYASMEMPFLPVMMGPLTAPPVQESLNKFMESTRLVLDYFAAAGGMGAELTFNLGIPSTLGGATKAPFDILGDTLRGTKGIMLDMYRQPEKLLEALERIVPIAVKLAVDAAYATGNPLIFIPLHKGADGFMSDRDFKKFYWPTFRKVLIGLIDAGLVPFPLVEGGYNSRLDVIAEDSLPAGKSIWLFDHTDMKAAKEKFGSWAAIGGNVPGSMFHSGTPQQIDAYVKDLIETVGKDGGFFTAPGVVLDHATHENMHAYFNAVRKYGVY